MANRCRLMSQIIWVNSDTMTSHKTRRKWQKIPLSASCVEHVVNRQSHFSEYHSDFVDKRDIDVALCIFNYFCRFGSSNIARNKHFPLGYTAVHISQHTGNFVRIARNYLRQVGERM